MKKLVTLILALALVLGMASFTVASSEGDYVKLTWVQGNSPAPIDNLLVLEEMNKITREELGVEVEIVYMSSDEVQLSIQTGEVYDMYFTCSWFNNFNNNVSNGIFANIWGKVQEWTPDLWATMSEDIWNMARTSTDGGLYGIPVKKDWAPMNMISYDAQIAQDAGIEIPDRIGSWDEMTDYLLALKAAMDENSELGSYPVYVGGAPAGMETSFDFIDRTPMIGVVFGDTKVVPWTEDEAVVERYRTMHKWYTMGLVNPDAATITEDAVPSDHHIGFTQAWTGYDFTASRGFWTKTTTYSGPFMSTDGVQGCLNAFSVTLEDDPERFELALKYQELVNTNKKLRDILAYGIEGVHFNYEDVKDADGNVIGQVVFRTEQGNSNYKPWRFSQANYAINSIEAIPEQLDGTYPAPVLDQWDLYFAECETAPVSAISGFTFDSANFNTEYAQISAIKQEYLSDIQCGVVDPDVAIPEMMAKMYDAGLQNIIDEAQRQLDEYLASKAE